MADVLAGYLTELDLGDHRKQLLSIARPSVEIITAVCMIGVKAGGVRLDFIHGIRLTDPSGLLQGQLLSKCYVPLDTIADTQQAGIEALSREAAAIDPTDWAEPSGPD